MMLILATVWRFIKAIPMAVWLVAAVISWGLWAHTNANSLRAAAVAEKAAAVAAARVAEQTANKSNLTIGDNLVVDTKKRSIRTAAVAKRLRNTAATFHVENAGPSAEVMLPRSSYTVTRLETICSPTKPTPQPTRSGAAKPTSGKL